MHEMGSAAARAARLFFDMCDLIATIRSPRDHARLFLPATRAAKSTTRSRASPKRRRSRASSSRRRSRGSSPKRRGGGGKRGAHSGAYHFLETERFTIDDKLGEGANGAVYTGTFGDANLARPLHIAVKINKAGRVSKRAEIEEVLMQTRLYCYARDHWARAQRTVKRTVDLSDAAHIPIPYFAVALPGNVGRAIGMERVHKTLPTYVHGLRSHAAQIDALHDAFAQIARLLYFLQHELEFMHGDMHGENIMVRLERDAPPQFYVIDFGMSSTSRHLADDATRRPRIITDSRYDGMTFNAYLDLLTCVTSVREELGLAGDLAASRWCDEIVAPYWDTVRRQLAASLERKGRPRAASARAARAGYGRFGAARAVQSADAMLQRKGEIYYAHHLLYENAEKLHFPPCSPLGLLRTLDRMDHDVPPPAQPYRRRVFEDFDA